MENRNELVEMTAEIVSAYVSANPVQTNELSYLIETVFAALRDVSGKTDGVVEEELTPAIAVRKSVTPDYIICLEDGKKFKSLKRHLRTRYGMTPEEYRARWNLPHDYPMVAPNYAKARSDLAKRMGLGLGRRAGED
jgi:predicted transcriptional regulator